MTNLIEDEYGAARAEFAATLAAALKIDAAVITDALASGEVRDSLEEFHAAWLEFDDYVEFGNHEEDDDEEEEHDFEADDGEGAE